MSREQHQDGRRRPGSSTTGGRVGDGRDARRGRTVVIGGIALGMSAAGLAGLPAQAINSNPPTGPGNIEVFPKRDMVAIEGYTEFAGTKAQIQVLRNGTVVGSAVGTVDGTGFLEVNHPGGVCWGAGTDLKVTPDIVGDDEIRVDFLSSSAGAWDGLIAQDVEITDVSRVDAANELIITGTFGPDVDMPTGDLVADPGRFGVEIVNPDLRGGTSAVGERAIGWPGEAGEVTTGYTVTGAITAGADGVGGEFQVRFTFDQASDLDLAEAGEVVGLAWQADAPVELGVEAQYGMTLYEYHEASGPGMGGCPAGPQEQRPNAPTVYTGKGAGDGRIEVTWDEGTTLPGAPAITGYEVVAVRAVGSGMDAGGIVRTHADGRGATVEGLSAGKIYSVEIASRSGSGVSAPSTMRIRAADHIAPTASATTVRVPNAQGKYLPLVTNINGDFGVHLDPVPGLLDAEVHYTVNGSVPTLTSPTFVPGESPSLQITQDTTVRWIVVDGGNIVSEPESAFFDIVEATNPAPDGVTAAPTAASGVIDVTFNRLADATVAAYRVQTYDETGTVRVGTPVSIAQPADGETVTRRVTGLTNGRNYTFTVAARYGTSWSVESAHSAPVAPQAAAKADAGPDQTILRGRQFVLDGGMSPRAVTYQWTQLRPAATANGGLPQDPQLDLNPDLRGTQSTTGASENSTLTLRAPLMTGPVSDHNLQFRLTTTHEDGTVKNDVVQIVLQADTVVVEDNRWRVGDEIGGTGSQENATLTILNGSATGPQIGQAIVSSAPGEWQYPGGTPAAIGGTLYIWSDYGFSAPVTVTN
ncbi:chitobiase/beta-hexosaminidase C-terminal domain-containing protein [uncultured Cellulomonas sp.]|uniref:chitobiase/beta-hexosaminidase C-terminal domain-containing protein n=1 Tax=uncultured Cellulomonas sp. TaxID=189682 RepID=UPI002602F109|nr:fibronectin type III domain-containing protein [uncultured Cellulomonas sp.]